MPNSKFFIGTYSGDVSNNRADYYACDWAAPVSASYQQQCPPTITPVESAFASTIPQNPYQSAAQVNMPSRYACPVAPEVSQCEAVASIDFPTHLPCDCQKEPAAPCQEEPSRCGQVRASGVPLEEASYQAFRPRRRNQAIPVMQNNSACQEEPAL